MAGLSCGSRAAIADLVLRRALVYVVSSQVRLWLPGFPEQTQVPRRAMPGFNRRHRNVGNYADDSDFLTVRSGWGFSQVYSEISLVRVDPTANRRRFSNALEFSDGFPL